MGLGSKTVYKALKLLAGPRGRLTIQHNPGQIVLAGGAGGGDLGWGRGLEEARWWQAALPKLLLDLWPLAVPHPLLSQPAHQIAILLGWLSLLLQEAPHGSPTIVP